MLDEKIESMDRADLRVLPGGSRLLESVAYVERHSPLFAETWGSVGLRASDISSLEEFRARVPFVDKDTVRAYRAAHGDPLGGLRRMADASALSSTTGTTGDPVVLPVGHGDGVGLARDWWEIGVRPGDAVAFMLFTFRGPAWLTTHALGASCRALRSPSRRSSIVGAGPRIELQPTLLYLLSGPLIMAMAYMERAGMLPYALHEVFASYKGVVIGGDHLGIEARGDLERWGGEPFLHTAVGDVRECDRMPGARRPARQRGLRPHRDPRSRRFVSGGRGGGGRAGRHQPGARAAGIPWCATGRRISCDGAPRPADAVVPACDCGRSVERGTRWWSTATRCCRWTSGERWSRFPRLRPGTFN